MQHPQVFGDSNCNYRGWKRIRPSTLFRAGPVLLRVRPKAPRAGPERGAAPRPQPLRAARGGRSGSTAGPARHVTGPAAPAPRGTEHTVSGGSGREPGGATGAGRARRAGGGSGGGARWWSRERGRAGAERAPGAVAGTGRRRAAAPAGSSPCARGRPCPAPAPVPAPPPRRAFPGAAPGAGGSAPHVGHPLLPPRRVGFLPSSPFTLPRYRSPVGGPGLKTAGRVYSGKQRCSVHPPPARGGAAAAVPCCRCLGGGVGLEATPGFCSRSLASCLQLGRVLCAALGPGLNAVLI